MEQVHERRKNGNRYGPESRYFDTIKGKSILIFWKHGGPEKDPLHCTLLWVDRFTIGVRLGGGERMIYKDAIESIEEFNA